MSLFELTNNNVKNDVIVNIFSYFYLKISLLKILF